MLAASFTLTFLDNIHAVTQVALVEDDIARLEMLAPDAGLKGYLGLRQLGREPEMEQPVGGDPNLAINARHLHQVNATPQAPCKESRDLDAANLRDGGAVSERTERSETL